MEGRGLDNHLDVNDDKKGVFMGHLEAFVLDCWEDGNVMGRRDCGFSLNTLTDASMGNDGKMPGRAGNVSLVSRERSLLDFDLRKF